MFVYQEIITIILGVSNAARGTLKEYIIYLYILKYKVSIV